MSDMLLTLVLKKCVNRRSKRTYLMHDNYSKSIFFMFLSLFPLLVFFGINEIAQCYIQ